jgi:hypothetical protein
MHIILLYLFTVTTNADSTDCYLRRGGTHSSPARGRNNKDSAIIRAADGACVSLTAAARVLGVGEPTLRHRIKTGHLAARAVGQGFVIEMREIRRYARINDRLRCNGDHK